MRVYTASMKTASVSTAKTLVLVRSSVAAVTAVLGAHVVAPENDVNEQLDFTWQRVNASGLYVGTLLTPAPMNKGDASFIGNVVGDLTTDVTSYLSNTEHGRSGASSIGGYHYQPDPESTFFISPGDIYGLRLLGAPETAKTFTLQVILGEVGG